MTGIVGSGFGLYGYLPAVVLANDESIGLLSRSHEAFKHRTELKFCEDSITWFSSEEVFFKSVSTVIFSVPPFIQVKYVQQNVFNENIQKIVLEKPIAPTPQEADSLLLILLANHKRVRVGYIFLYTFWAQEIKKQFETTNDVLDTLTIDWSFKAHHYKNNLETWKRYHHCGGSVLRFFGIQLIALLAHWGYTISQSKTIGYSEDDFYKWKALFLHPSKPSCEINIDSNSDASLFIVALKSLLHKKLTIDISLTDPFGGNPPLAVDKRVSILSSLINDNNPEVDYDFYFAVNSLWSEVERINESVIT